MLVAGSLFHASSRLTGRPLQIDCQDSENDIRERYLEETDQQDRTR